MLVLIAFHLLTLLTRFVLTQASGTTDTFTTDEMLNGSVNRLNVSRAILTTLKQDSGEHPIVCFATSNEVKVLHSPWKAVAADCRYILNEVISQLSYIFEEVEFGNTQYRSPAGDVLPAVWVHGQCTVYVMSSFTDERAFMSLMEVVLTAHKILTKCLMQEKHQRGGISHVGSIVKFFYVALLGPSLRPGSLTGPGSNTSNLPDLDISKRSINPTPPKSGASLG